MRWQAAMPPSHRQCSMLRFGQLSAENSPFAVVVVGVVAVVALTENQTEQVHA